MRWKRISWSLATNGLFLASLFLLPTNLQAQDAKSASSQPGYGFHQTTWQSWPSKSEPESNRTATGTSLVEPAKPVPQTGHARRSQTANSVIPGAPIVRRRVVETAPVIQQATYLESVPAKRPVQSVPKSAPVPNSPTELQPLNWVASPTSVPAQPKVSQPIEKVNVSPTLEATPATIEWVPVRPSASPYSPQS
jgi:hypothetical protein